MDARNSRFATQFTRLLTALALVLLLAGCDVKVINRTPATFSENPSQVYTITAEVKVRGGVVQRPTIKPNVVIDGQIFPMTKSDLGENLWEFDYKLPMGRVDGAYYILATYETNSNGKINRREAYTELQKFSVVNRYSLSLDANRAPVGAQVSVLGRGFTQQDVVYVGDTTAQTSFRSSNALSFVVPALPAGRNYPVSVGAPGVGLDVGTLRIDEGTLSIFPSSLALTRGARRQVVFSIPSDAPDGGLMLDITTDVPASVIMPEVTIPAGARSVSVVVEGGEAGSGSIYVKAPGFGENSISISVVGG